MVERFGLNLVTIRRCGQCLTVFVWFVVVRYVGHQCRFRVPDDGKRGRGGGRMLRSSKKRGGRVVVEIEPPDEQEKAR